MIKAAAWSNKLEKCSAVSAEVDVPTVVTMITQPVAPSKVQLISPAMFEDASAVFRELSDNAEDSQNEEAHSILGYLKDAVKECSYPVRDQCTIGRDSSCAVVVEGREVSRLHAKVVYSGGHVTLEPLSKINHVRVNGKVVYLGQEVVLMEGDKVQVGKDVLVWSKEGGDKQQNSEGCEWGEKTRNNFEFVPAKGDYIGDSDDSDDEDINSVV